MIIGLSGKKQSGKDTLANALADIIWGNSYLAERYAFADALKDLCGTVFNIPYQALHGTDEDKNAASPIRWSEIPLRLRLLRKPEGVEDKEFITRRQLLQVFGTDVCRDFYENFWVNWTIKKIKDNRNRNPYPAKHEIITDVRFPNEAERIKEEGGIIIRLTRNVNPDDYHPSETSMDKYDFSYIHDNQNMTIEESIQSFMELLKKEGLI